MDYLGNKNIVTNLDDVALLDEDYCIGRISRHSTISCLVKMRDYGCVICLAGETKGSIDLMPYTFGQSVMAVHVPGQLVVLQNDCKRCHKRRLQAAGSHRLQPPFDVFFHQGQMRLKHDFPDCLAVTRDNGQEVNAL
ncbi:MAG: hypothetical protein ACI4BA_03435 [Prevotella sp.]